ncbi:WSC domain-containing protein [Trichoderma gamsii]|uniref:Peroxidase n=1 Tax=Trichoderma gamsii TaxID=398673 RepID=A0A2P4Z741_9HYPO|nr:WSC domain-containing protein [Trichoderma gamsii]PON20089.1 WSC domain-containing protein [Trichoderma gamsii]
MAWTRAILYSALSSYLWHPANANYVWPNEEIDELERILFEQDSIFGQPGSDLASFVSGCSGFGDGPQGGERNFGAEWLRTAYHDMATADVNAGTGGLDASILFETDRPENPGKAFSETFGFFSAVHSPRSSMSDLFAMAAVIAVGSCSNGKVIIPYRGGRVDAAGPGPSGVPQPQEDLASHTASFARQGFDVTEMIQLVACGHSIGGVHGVDFPEIVPNPPNTGTDNMVTFDTTNNDFDNKVAKEFVANNTQNPLAFGQNETTRSDFRIFNADGGKVISQLADSNDYFLSTCTTMLERMINTVPRSVKLTDIIKPIAVKPRNLFITPNADGTLYVNGFIRIANTTADANKSQVFIHPKSRSGKLLPVATATTKKGMSGGCDYPNCGPDFIFYMFNTTISAEDGISSFTIEIQNDAAGKTSQFDNGGSGFPFSDALQPLFSLSNQTESVVDNVVYNQLNVTALVLNAEDFSDISLIINVPVNLTAPISPWTQSKVSMKPLSKVPGTNHTLYTGSWKAASAAGTVPFDIVATGNKSTVSSLFNSWDNVPQFFDE